MPKFENVEVYVRVCDFGYEGESVRFATIDEDQAVNYFSPYNMSSDDEGIYAPDTHFGEELRVYLNGVLVETWSRRDDKWVKGYGENQVERGVIKGSES